MASTALPDDSRVFTGVQSKCFPFHRRPLCLTCRSRCCCWCWCTQIFAYCCRWGRWQGGSVSAVGGRCRQIRANNSQPCNYSSCHSEWRGVDICVHWGASALWQIYTYTHPLQDPLAQSPAFFSISRTFVFHFLIIECALKRRLSYPSYLRSVRSRNRPLSNKSYDRWWSWPPYRCSQSKTSWQFIIYYSLLGSYFTQLWEWYQGDEESEIETSGKNNPEVHTARKGIKGLPLSFSPFFFPSFFPSLTASLLH